MNIAEARSHENGIEFYVKGKNIIVNVNRDERGNTVITKDVVCMRNRRDKRMTTFLCVIVLLYMCVKELIRDFNSRINLLVILGFVWILVAGYFIINYAISKNKFVFKYHAAEHKTLNYYDKNNGGEMNIEDVGRMSSVSIRCGSTILTVILIFLSLVLLSIMFLPHLWTKIIGCIVSTVITLYLWANGKCDFFQKLTLKEPSEKEIEIAVTGFKEYLRLKSNN